MTQMHLRVQRGITLVETMIAITITGLMAAVLFVVFVVSTRLWARCSAQSQAYPPACIVVSRINQELKNTIGNSVKVSNSITAVAHGTNEYDTLIFRAPLTDGDGLHGTDIIPLKAGREIRYYPVLNAASDTNHNGTLDAGEDWRYFLYRRETNLTTNPVTILSDRAIAENAQLPVFTCAATESGRVFAIYSTVITIVGAEGAKRFNSTFRSIMAVRNPAGT